MNSAIPSGYRQALQRIQDLSSVWPNSLVSQIHEIASAALSTTPSQRLDAATVERCAINLFCHARRASQNRATAEAAWLTIPEDTRESVRGFARAALATDPHQHGGKGA